MKEKCQWTLYNLIYNKIQFETKRHSLSHATAFFGYSSTNKRKNLAVPKSFSLKDNKYSAKKELKRHTNFLLNTQLIFLLATRHIQLHMFVFSVRIKNCYFLINRTKCDLIILPFSSFHFLIFRIACLFCVRPGMQSLKWQKTWHLLADDSIQLASYVRWK